MTLKTRRNLTLVFLTAFVLIFLIFTMGNQPIVAYGF